MSTNVYDWTTVTSPAEALDWFNNSIRKAAEYNVFGDKTVFEAIVLADAFPLSVNAVGVPGYPPPPDGNTDPTWGVNTRFAFKARIVGNPSPHAFLPDPCDPRYETDDALLNTSIIDSHTTFISQVGYSTDAAKRPKAGDIVEVRLRPGPNGYDLQYADFIKVLDSYRHGAEENVRPQCTSMEALFRLSPGLGGATASSQHTAALDAFYNKLRNSDHFSGFKDEFLMGLAANAQHESALNLTAKGDQRPADDIGPAIQVGNDYFCSFGYWQLNVCADGGGGQAFADFFGVSHEAAEDKPRLKALITVEENQFRFMRAHMLTLFPKSQNGQNDNKTASEWAQEIAIEFERCSWCKRAPSPTLKTVGGTTHREDHETVSRGLTAAALEASINASAAN